MTSARTASVPRRSARLRARLHPEFPAGSPDGAAGARPDRGGRRLRGPQASGSPTSRETEVPALRCGASGCRRPGSGSPTAKSSVLQKAGREECGGKTQGSLVLLQEEG